jgi:hypothetical protein
MISNALFAVIQSLWLYSLPFGPGRFFRSYTQSILTPWTRDQPVARPLPIHRTTQTRNKRTETSMPRVGCEPTTPVFERGKTARPLWSAFNTKLSDLFTAALNKLQKWTKNGSSSSSCNYQSERDELGCKHCWRLHGCSTVHSRSRSDNVCGSPVARNFF